MPLRLCELPGGRSEEFYNARWAGCGQLLGSSRIGWHQGEVSNVSFLVLASLGSVFLWSAVYIWRQGSASCKKKKKKTLGICVRPLSVSFRELGVWCCCSGAELKSKLLIVPQPNSHSLFLHFPIINSWVINFLQKTRTLGLVHHFNPYLLGHWEGKVDQILGAHTEQDLEYRKHRVRVGYHHCIVIIVILKSS